MTLALSVKAAALEASVSASHLTSRGTQSRSLEPRSRSEGEQPRAYLAMKPRLLDLFCGAGGAAMGYSRAGFEVIGVDINPQPHYPFPFIKDDAMAYMQDLFNKLMHGGRIEFDAIHASPPCQAYTRKEATWGRKRTHWTDHPDLLEPTREWLHAINLPFVIENVPGSPIEAGVMLCGTMFSLRIQKHRLFETNWPLPALAPAACDHRDTYTPWQGAGRTGQKLRDAQGTPWIPMGGGASRKAGYTGDLFNAIPPVYTEWIGGYLLEVVEARRPGLPTDSAA